jgi:hypothetical protein
MSLHNSAQHLASQGRYGDNMLVHMNPREVAGLQALAEQKGTKLTVNPQTGMPEAFSLGDLNPFRIVQGKGEIGESGLGGLLIGAALNMAFPGLGALQAGLLTGGATLAMGGNARQAIGQGLGAYGGASMMGGAGAAPHDPSAVPVSDAVATPVAPAAAPVMAPAQTTAPLMDYGAGAGTFTGAQAAPVATATPMPVAATPMPAATAKPIDIGFGPDKFAPTAQMTPMGQVGQFVSDYKYPLMGAGALTLLNEEPKGVDAPQIRPGKIRPYTYDPKTGALTQLSPYDAPGYAMGGPVEAMSNASAIGMNTGYPQADITGHTYSTPWQTPMSQNVVQGTADTGVNRMTGQMLAEGGISGLMNYARGGNVSTLGDYSDGGRLLKGPGDGVSDSIPATIAGKQPARLADGEFVVPARIVSEIGNGSTDAGARKLYAMMDRVQKARRKTTGKNRVAANTRSDKYLPA